MNKLEHISTIDFCYWRLKILCEQLSKPKSNIEIMVDNACGYNETEEIRKEGIILLEQIIEKNIQKLFLNYRVLLPGSIPCNAKC